MIRIERSFLLALPFVAMTLASASAIAAPPTFHEAKAAYMDYEVTRAEQLYRAVADDPAAPSRDRAAARRELARILWLVDGRQPEAARLLSESLKQDPDPCPAALLYGRVLNDGPQPAGAPALLAPFAHTCADIEPDVAVEAVRAHHLAATALPFKARARAVRQALDAWHALPAAARRSTAAARLRLAIGLAAGNGAEALAGWRDYFWLEEGRSVPPAFGIDDARAEAAFHARTPADRLTLARLLLRAGFAPELRQFIADRQLGKTAAGTPEWASITTYLSFRETLEKDVLAFNRAWARGRATPDDAAAFEARLRALLKETAQQLGSRDEDPMPVLRREWGLDGLIGDTNGVMSLHLGHAMIDEDLPVAQDKRQASVRFRVLDTMIENSFSGWLWDGEQAPGGWAEDGQVIVQVRPVYTAGIEAVTAQVLPGPARDRALAPLPAAEAEDLEIARRSRIVSLPGVRMRLRRQALDQLARQVAERHGTGEAFAAAFRRTYWQEINRNSITLHEGRHVLDQAEAGDTLDSAELEYRAKLSEIGLSNSPRLALAGIYGQTLEGDSTHADANRRIIAAYADWIETHAGEVAGFDPSLPALLQLDRLTDDQLRTVVRSIDPANRAAR